MKILINTPHIKILGGVANHYKGLKGYWNENVSYNCIGGRLGIPGPIVLIFDVLKFIYKCIFWAPDVVVLNPSLGNTALKRDGLFLNLSKMLGFATVVFFHGWDKEQESKISSQPNKFIQTFKKADAFLVLASTFKKKLVEWGIDKPIYLTTTKVDDSLIQDFNIQEKPYGKNILFLARIIEKKGIFTSLKAFKKIKKRYPLATFTVAGNGEALDDAKNLVNTYSIKDVNFTGYITGRKLKKVFQKSDIYLFPTEYGEGMPTSVLESMAFGLPIISRPVGGIADFFEENKMGYLFKSTDPEVYAEKVIELFENEQKLEKIGKFNHEYACKNFLASEVALNLEGTFEKVMINNEF